MDIEHGHAQVANVDNVMDTSIQWKIDVNTIADTTVQVEETHLTQHVATMEIAIATVAAAEAETGHQSNPTEATEADHDPEVQEEGVLLGEDNTHSVHQAKIAMKDHQATVDKAIDNQ